MKKTHAILLSTIISLSTFAQTEIFPPENGGEYFLGRNDESTPCITTQQYAAMEQRCNANCAALNISNSNEGKMMTTTFNWPLRMANGLNDCGYYVIFNYVDQDVSTALQDWNCGTVTYDGHHGNDICPFPYPFYKMDNNEVEVIAAAPGTIIDKVDGNFDKNCAMNNQPANYMVIQHADGSRAIYYHMKINSLTSKIIGQTVAAGEYLGVVGSSGNSTGPHLHFEVWSGSSFSTLNDAFAGPCNILNNNSWWAAQKPYTEPAILKVQVNNIAAVLPACPATETPNEDSCFIGGGIAKFYFFMRNETIGLTANMRIINPNGTTFSSWTHNSTTNYLASYWYYNILLPSTAGTYTYEAVYNGDTCRKTFMVNCNTTGIVNENASSTISIFPNPARDEIMISGMEKGNAKITITDILGQVVLYYNSNIEKQKTISIAGLKDGVYFVIVEEDGMRVVKKIVKEN